MEVYLTIEELADYLKLAVQTVRRWVMKREIPFHKVKSVIRFRLSEIEKWVDNGGVNIAVQDDVFNSVSSDDVLFVDRKAEELPELEIAESEVD